MTMTIDELKEICEKMMDEGKGHWPVIVAFEWKGDTVVSDIVSACQNGMTLQLDEYDFYHRKEEINA